MVYKDFDLLIDRSGDSLRAQVLNSPAGQATAEFRLPFSEDKLENYLLRLGRTRRNTRRVESQEMNTAKTFGAALFDAVFTGDVKACFRSSIDEARRENAGLRVRLRLGDPSVVDLPWEFLYNRAVNRFIALSVHTPLVRYMDLPERIQPIAVTPPIRVLVMISSPADFPALDVGAEWDRLNESLADLIASGQLAIERLETASLQALQRRLRRETYHIFHFIGHGEFDQELQEGVLILEAENKRGHRVDSQFLGMLLHDHESLRVAILNACEGARTSRTDPFAGSAQSLVQQGIPAVIAMQFEISDDVASRFAHEFYGALADGYPIDASLTEARKSIFAAGREVEWGTPVLYLRAPDGRIFDIEPARPRLAPLGHDSSLKGLESSNHAEDRHAREIVAAAHAAFEGGNRLQALEMLRRGDSRKRPIADALRELTLEHERLNDEERHAARGKLEEHLQAANAHLLTGHLSEAWAHACDALQVDATDQDAIALEARIRAMLDEQAARDLAREQEEARRADAERSLAAERDDALTRSRMAIENSVASGNLDYAEEELNRADQSFSPGEAFADLRARVLELREHSRLEHDRAADEIIDRARGEFATTPGGAAELLERFSPPHPRVTAALRELQELIAEQNEQAIREAEQRGEEARERQRNKEQRRRDMQLAVERIRGYLDRQELTEAAAALKAARDTFGPSSVFEELRARVRVAERRLQHDDAAKSAVGHGKNLAAAGDHEAALKLLEAFKPRHPEVDKVAEDLRRERAEAQRRSELQRPIAAPVVATDREPSREPAPGRVLAFVLQPHFLLAAAVLFLLAAAGIWLTSRGGILNRRGTGGSTPVATAGTTARAETAKPVSTPADGTSASRDSTAAPPAPTASSPGTPTAPPESAPAPLDAPPATGSAPDTVAEFQTRIQALLARKEPEYALEMLTSALAHAPRDKGLRALGQKVAEQARTRMTDERSRAIAQGAAGLAKFKQAERTAQKAHTSFREGKSAVAARGFFDAADLYASAAAESVSRRDPTKAGRRVKDFPVTAGGGEAEAESSPGDNPTPKDAEAPAAVPPAKPGPPATATPRPPVDPVIDAYAAAVSRGDRRAVLAVYPNAPSSVLDNLGKRPPGIAAYTMDMRISMEIKDDTDQTSVKVVVTHQYTTASGKSEVKQENRTLVLQRHGESWVLVENYPNR